jgi:hypothetical protein
MNIENMTDQELLDELNRRKESREESAEPEPKDVLVFGTTCVEGKEDYIEVFRKIEKPEDLPNMFNLEMRASFNSHRNYRKFYFKTSLESFEELSKAVETDNNKIATELCKNPKIKFERL